MSRKNFSQVRHLSRARSPVGFLLACRSSTISTSTMSESPPNPAATYTRLGASGLRVSVPIVRPTCTLPLLPRLIPGSGAGRLYEHWAIRAEGNHLVLRAATFVPCPEAVLIGTHVRLRRPGFWTRSPRWRSSRPRGTAGSRRSTPPTSTRTASQSASSGSS